MGIKCLIKLYRVSSVMKQNIVLIAVSVGVLGVMVMVCMYKMYKSIRVENNMKINIDFKEFNEQYEHTVHMLH